MLIVCAVLNYLFFRPPFLDEKFLTLPKLTQIHYELELHDFFPDNVELHTDLLEHETIKIEDSIYHDKVKFTVDIGKGQSLTNKKSCLYFLDETSFSAARQVNLSRLKIKTRLFVDQGLPPS